MLVRENREAPVVAYSLMVKMGTRTETPDNAGISNLLQQMLVRGTEKLDGEQIAEAADRMGGGIDAYGDVDYSEITATALSRNWQEMLELVGDCVLRPTLPDGTVQAVRNFLVRQIRNRGDKPFDVAADRCARRSSARTPTPGTRSAAARAWRSSTARRSSPTTGASTFPGRWSWP